MKHLLLLPIIFPLALLAQTPSTPCYTDFRNEGLGLMKKKDYGEAMSQFVAALVTCKDVPAENDLSRLIGESKRLWADKLQVLVAEAQNAERVALAAQKIAENAKTAEAAARLTAEVNAQNAHKRGIRAESFRLALLADMARQQGNKTDALLLSWMGMQMSDTLQPFLMHAFGEAVRDTFTKTFFSHPDEIESVQYLSGGQHILLKTSTPSFFIVHLSEPVAVTQLPAQLIQVLPSPRDNRLIAWGNNSNALIINTEGKTVATLSGHSENIRSAVFSADAEMILTCSRDNTARIWDNSGNVLAVLEGHTGNVQHGTFSPDGTKVITRSSDGSSKIWDTKGSLISTIQDNSKIVLRAFFSSKNVVFAHFSDYKLQVLDATGANISSKEVDQIKFQKLQPSPDAAFLAAQSGTRAILIFDALGQTKALLAHSTDLSGFIFSADSKYLISWGLDNVVRLWTTAGVLLAEFKGHRKNIRSADYNERKKILLSTSADGTTKLWNNSGNLLTEWVHGSKTTATAVFSPLGDRVLTIGETGKSATLSPLPQDIYEKTDRAALMSSAPVGRAKLKYDIQFLEALELEK